MEAIYILHMIFVIMLILVLGKRENHYLKLYIYHGIRQKIHIFHLRLKREETSVELMIIIPYINFKVNIIKIEKF